MTPCLPWITRVDVATLRRAHNPTQPQPGKTAPRTAQGVDALAAVGGTPANKIPLTTTEVKAGVDALADNYEKKGSANYFFFLPPTRQRVNTPIKLPKTKGNSVGGLLADCTFAANTFHLYGRRRRVHRYG